VAASKRVAALPSQFIFIFFVDLFFILSIKFYA